MPRMNDNTDEYSFGGSSNFKFSGVRTEHLTASEYTLVNIGVDVTGSTGGFSQELRNCLIAAVQSCKKSPRSDNLLLRVYLFSSIYAGGIHEIHGFKPLAEIDPNDYPQLDSNGMTPLYDAAYSAVGSINSYAKALYDDEFMSNAISFIITDGADNDSAMGPMAVRKEVESALTAEFLESHIIVLIGINVAQYRAQLEHFQKEAKLDKFIDAGDATPSKLAKLAEFVSQSVSSQSQSLGTGGPSQAISATI